MKSAALTLAKREFVNKIHTRHVIALMLVYALLIVTYSSIIYTDFIDALHNVNIYNVTVIGIPKPVPNAVLLGNMTLFLTLGPLFVISIAFGSLSHERSTRSLNLLLSYPVSRFSILMGKVLGLTLVFVPVVVSLPVIIVALSLRSVGPLSAQLALRLVSLELLSILYLLFWLALTILISTVTLQPEDSLAISATIWLLLQSNIFPWLENAFVLGFVLHTGPEF